MSDTPSSSDPITLIRTINSTAAFNRWCGIDDDAFVFVPQPYQSPRRLHIGNQRGSIASSTASLRIIW